LPFLSETSRSYGSPCGVAKIAAEKIPSTPLPCKEIFVSVSGADVIKMATEISI
jgi:hypothetical protein